MRQLRKIEAQANARIRDSVTKELADLSTARNVKALTNHEYDYRLRVGSYTKHEHNFLFFNRKDVGGR
ncbi:MAG: hypothetical protein ACRER2_18170 [Methylococcales bacterium]